MMGKIVPEPFLAFLEKFNQGEYYECHDLLEELWLEDRRDKFLQGLLQLSVGLYHFECGNLKGARWMFQNARKYLVRYAPQRWGLDVNRVLDYLDRCLAALPERDAVSYEEARLIPLPRIQLYIDDPDDGES